MKSRVAVLAGTLRRYRAGESFVGRVCLELRPDCVYYTCRLEAKDGEFLGSVSRPVSLRVVPDGEDPLEFALSHAVEGVRRYRFGRERPFDVTRWEWLPPNPTEARST